MSRHLRYGSIVQGVLDKSTIRRYPQPGLCWGYYSVLSKQYSSENNKSNINNSFKKYGFGLLAAFGALFAAYQFKVIPNFGDDKDQFGPDKKKSKTPRVFKYPKDSNLIPNKVPYLLIGAGTASFSAFRAIKSADPTAKVLIIGNEPYNPYMRPPLSKELFYNEDRSLAKSLKFKQWNASERSLFYEPEDFYTPVETLFPVEPESKPDEQPYTKSASETGTPNTKPVSETGTPNTKPVSETGTGETPALVVNHGGISVARGWQVTKLDASHKIVTLEDGKTIHFDKCLIATGSTPRNLPVFTENGQAQALAPHVTVYRNVQDFQALESIMMTGSKTIAVVGGGFLGSELACALSKRGASLKSRVYQIFQENGNMARVLPEYLSAWTTIKVQEEDVLTLAGVKIEGATLRDGQVELSLSGDKKLKVDHVVVAVGVEPNTQLAKEAGLETDPQRGGFLVNSELEARSDIYVAGDCACFYDPALGRRRIEHHDHAVQSGRLAGENMTGTNKHYHHQSMFWSDLGPDVGYEAIGIIDSALPTVGIYAKSTDTDTPQAASLASGTSDRSNVQLSEEPKPSAAPAQSSNKSKPNADYGKGVIFYLRDDIVVGILLWNVFNKMSLARQVLKSERKYEDLNEVAKLFNIHKE